MRGFGIVLFAAALSLAAGGLDLSGKWSGSFVAVAPDGQNHDSGAYAVFKQTGDQLGGTIGPDEGNQWTIEKGSVNGNKVTIEAKSADDGTSFKCDLVLEGDHLKGPIAATRPDGEKMSATLDLTRVK